MAETQNPPPAGLRPMNLSAHDLTDAERRDQYLSGILHHAYKIGLGDQIICPTKMRLISIVTLCRFCVKAIYTHLLSKSNPLDDVAQCRLNDLT